MHISITSSIEICLLSLFDEAAYILDALEGDKLFEDSISIIHHDSHTCPRPLALERQLVIYISSKETVAVSIIFIRLYIVISLRASTSS